VQYLADELERVGDIQDDVEHMVANLTVLVKSRHYAHLFKQEVSLDEGTAGI
jgi:hypothetical protein